MKKILSMALALCMIFALCACGQTAAPAEAPAAAAPEAAGEVAAEPVATEAVELNVVVVSDLEPLEPVFQQYAEENGIKINVESIPYAEIFNTIEVRLGAGESSKLCSKELSWQHEPLH